MEKNDLLECGFITSIHGLKGALVIKHSCDSYDVFASLKTLYIQNVPYKVTRVSPYKGDALVYLDGVSDADKATLLRRKTVFASRDEFELDEGSFFIVDLIGLPVYDADTKEKYGVLKDVTNSGAQDIYVVEGDEGKLSYVPAIKEFVTEISLENGIFIRPIEGMIE